MQQADAIKQKRVFQQLHQRSGERNLRRLAGKMLGRRQHKLDHRRLPIQPDEEARPAILVARNAGNRLIARPLDDDPVVRYLRPLNSALGARRERNDLDGRLPSLLTTRDDTPDAVLPREQEGLAVKAAQVSDIQPAIHRSGGGIHRRGILLFPQLGRRKAAACAMLRMAEPDCDWVARTTVGPVEKGACTGERRNHVVHGGSVVGTHCGVLHRMLLHASLCHRVGRCSAKTGGAKAC